MRETQCASLWLSPSPWQRPLVLEAVSGTTRRPWSHSQHRPSNSPALFPAAAAFPCGSSQPRSDLAPSRGFYSWPTKLVISEEAQKKVQDRGEYRAGKRDGPWGSTPK
jgi:hypothetical protein